ncbi:MAG: endonuclease III [Gammaproteobacteria bacterium]|nr:endonuclease III [Gammaproteobacteria bacterium]
MERAARAFPTPKPATIAHVCDAPAPSSPVRTRARSQPADSPVRYGDQRCRRGRRAGPDPGRDGGPRRPAAALDGARAAPGAAPDHCRVGGELHRPAAAGLAVCVARGTGALCRGAGRQRAGIRRRAGAGGAGRCQAGDGRRARLRRARAGHDCGARGRSRADRPRPCVRGRLSAERRARRACAGGGPDARDPARRRAHRLRPAGRGPQHVRCDAPGRDAGPLKPAACRALFSRLRELNPEPRTELAYANPFELLVAVILSAQASDASVNRVTPQLFAAAPDAVAMCRLGERRVRALIRSIGLFNTKARNIVATSRLLVQRHGGAVPRDRAALEALPGVGRKTANVVLNTVFGEPVIAVDTHIFRVANRTGLAPGATALAVEKALLRAVPAEFRQNAHHWLVLHGRYTCTARRPRCESCPIRDLCAWPDRQAGSGSASPRRRPARA